VEVVLDMEQDGALALDPWWQWDGAGCRSGGLAAILDPTLNPGYTATSCQNPYAASGFGPAGGIAALQRPSTGTGIGPASQRIIVGVALQPNDPVALAAGTQYVPVTLRYRATTAQTAACGGVPSCSTPVAFMLNSIFVAQLPGSPGGDITLTEPLPDQQGGFLINCLSVNGSTTCPQTPGIPDAAQSRTWGQLKSLYR
jgi:hypothetical protein